LTLRKN